MIKRMLSSGDDHGVGLLAAANLAFANVQQFLSSIAPILNTMLTVGQVAVAAVTVFYIWRKAMAVRVPARRKKKR
jgi:hypothetical protein